MKKTIPVILLCALFFNFTAYICYFHINQFLIKKEIKEAAGNEALLEKISLPTAEYSHAIGEDEIFIGDKLYDIVKYEISGADIIFHCIHDSDEQSLFAFFESLLEGEGNENIEDIPLSFLSLTTIFYDSENLVKNSIYLATIRDIAPLINSQKIIPGTQPPKTLLFA